MRFLDQCPLPTLSTGACKVLHAPITLEELTEAVASMANSKSPGTGGLPAEIYKRYSEPLLILLDTLNAAERLGGLPQSMNEAVIVIPKPEKDPVLPDSYRSISLINTDIKLLARVLATRLAGVAVPLGCFEKVPGGEILSLLGAAIVCSSSGKNTN